MLLLALFLLGAAVIVPIVAEVARLPMNASERSNAPGKFADLSQGKTHYKWTGPEDGPIVICIHGLTTPSFVWKSTARKLAEAGYRVLTYDLYGRGYSDRPLGRQAPAFFLQQLNDLCEHLELQSGFTLVGYSMGGIIAPAFAASRPDDIRQVALLAPAGMLPVGDTLFQKAARLPVIGLWLMLLMYPRILKQGIDAEADIPTSVPDIGLLQAAELDYRGFIPSVHASLRGMLSHDHQATHELLYNEGIPVLAVWGAQDDVIALRAKDVLNTWNPDAVHHVIEDAGHGLTYTHTDDVAEQLLLFLKMSS